MQERIARKFPVATEDTSTFAPPERTSPAARTASAQPTQASSRPAHNAAPGFSFANIAVAAEGAMQRKEDAQTREKDNQDAKEQDAAGAKSASESQSQSSVAAAGVVRQAAGAAAPIDPSKGDAAIGDAATRPLHFGHSLARIPLHPPASASPSSPASSSLPLARSPLQRQAASALDYQPEPALAPLRPLQRKPNQTGLPDQLKAGVESLSGLSLDDVKVHRNSSKPKEVEAHAYAQGSDIHLGPGQEEHLPHEAWHVVQQKQGRVQPTIQAKGVAINDDQGLEREADVMGGRASLLDVTPVQALERVAGQPVHHLVQRLKGTRRAPEGDYAETPIQRVLQVSLVNQIPSDPHALTSKRRKVPLQRVLSIKNPQGEDYKTISDVSQIWHDLVPHLQGSVVEGDYEKIQTILINWINAGGGMRVSTLSWLRNWALGYDSQRRQYSSYEDLASAVVGTFKSQDKVATEEELAKKVLESTDVQKHAISAVKKLKARLDDIDKANPELNLYQKLAEYKGNYGWYTMPYSYQDLLNGESEEIKHQIVVIHDIMEFLRKETLELQERKKDKTAKFHDGKGKPVEYQPHNEKRKYRVGPNQDREVEDMGFRINDTTLNEQYDWVKEARRNDALILAGPSHTTARMLRVITDAGAEEAELRAVAWGVFAFWRRVYSQAATGMHTLHEVMDVARNYVPGIYDPFKTPEFP